MNEALLKLAATNPALTGAVVIIALNYLLKTIFEYRRHSSTRGNDNAILENLSAQTASLKALVESNTRQEGAIGAQTSALTALTTSMAISMDRQSDAKRVMESVATRVPEICKFRKAG